MTDNDSRPSAAWPLMKRILFRFTAAFFILVSFPFPLDLIPSFWLTARLRALPDVSVRAMARLLHVSIDILPNGSGDSTYSWVHLLCIAIGAVLITLVWSLIDRRPRNYDRAWI